MLDSSTLFRRDAVRDAADDYSLGELPFLPDVELSRRDIECIERANRIETERAPLLNLKWNYSHESRLPIRE